MNFDNSNIVFSFSDNRRDIQLPSKLNTELAELMGIMLGDGCIYIKENKPQRIKYEIFIYGHAYEDLEYHKKTTCKLFNKLFNINPYIRKISNTNGIKICVTSKAITKFLIENARFTAGNKVKNKASIPSYFFNSNDNKIIASVLRGLADTDFYLRFKKRKDYKYNKNHHYPLIIGRFASKIMVEQMIILLNKIGINSHLESGERITESKKFKHYSVVVVGKKNLNKWIKIIGFNNPKHKTKYLIWKKFGFCPPNTNLAIRAKILKEGKMPL